MNLLQELSEKINAAKTGKRDIIDTYVDLWISSPNISKDELNSLIALISGIDPGSDQTRARIALCHAIYYSLWAGTGNAFEKLSEALEHFRQINDDAGEGVALAFFSLYYKNLGQLDRAQECVNESILKLKDKPKFVYFFGVAHFQGGEINQLLNDYDAALDFLTKGLSYFENDKSTFRSRLLNGIGNIYKSKNELELAFEYFENSLKHIEGKDNTLLETKNYSDIGNYYLRKGDIEKSLEFQLKSLDLRKKFKLSRPTISNYLELAELHLKQSNLNEALENALLAETLAKEHNVIGQVFQAYLIISTIYEAMGRSAEALTYFKKYHNTKEQVSGQESARKIKQINMHNEVVTAQKEKEIFKLRNVVLKEALDEINSSVRYAKRIQEAILAPIELVQAQFKEAFVLYKPKDIVAGDFYWMEKHNDLLYIAVADCTGHGVPGALVSVVCSNSLNRCVYEYKLVDPAAILEKCTELVCQTFEKSTEDVKDGMDISLLVIDKSKKQCWWSGANNPLWYFEKDEFHEIEAVKRPIGKSEITRRFVSHSVNYTHNTMFYLFTDGYADQFGGPLGKKFKYKPIVEKLRSNIGKPATEQKAELETAFENWKGNLEQVDDVCIIGIKI